MIWLRVVPSGADQLIAPCVVTYSPSWPPEPVPVEIRPHIGAALAAGLADKPLLDNALGLTHAAVRKFAS
jgi:hypothetical protein